MNRRAADNGAVAGTTGVRTLLAAGSSGALSALTRLRSSGWRITEGTAAATLAWIVDVRLFQHPAPFFAPAAALIAIGVTRGQRLQRAVEVVLGVALGVLVADVLAKALAPHLTLTILIITGLTLIVATLLDGGPILSVQAAVSGIYVAVVASPRGGLIPSRFVDALVGGGVALAVNQLPLPRSLPNRLLRGAAPVFSEIAAVLEAVGSALAAHDETAAREALERARALDGAVAGFEALAGAEMELARFDPLRRRQRDLLRGYERAARQLDLAARNVRVLARAGLYLSRGVRPAPVHLAPAVAMLARAVRDLGGVLAGEATASDQTAGEPTHGAATDGEVADGRPGELNQVARIALAAVRVAAQALAETHDVPVVMIVGQVRATAVDLMVGSGLNLQDVLAVAEEALGQHSALDR
jgi:uncharacterized membrane protein YgaE (UPF0421/DUF939 family)